MACLCDRCGVCPQPALWCGIGGGDHRAAGCARCTAPFRPRLAAPYRGARCTGAGGAGVACCCRWRRAARRGGHLESAGGGGACAAADPVAGASGAAAAGRAPCLGALKRWPRASCRARPRLPAWGWRCARGESPRGAQGGAAALSCAATMVQILAVAATVRPQWLGRLWAPALAGALAAALGWALLQAAGPVAWAAPGRTRPCSGCVMPC